MLTKILLAACLWVAVSASPKMLMKMLDGTCPEWGPWQQSQCLWPSQSYDSLPDACRNPPMNPDYPEWLMQYAQSKKRELYETMQANFQQLGAPQPCGYCSFRKQCRTRQVQNGQQILPWCKPYEVEYLDDQPCPGSQACSLTPDENGSCMVDWMPEKMRMMKKMVKKMAEMKKKKMMKEGSGSGEMMGCGKGGKCGMMGRKMEPEPVMHMKKKKMMLSKLFDGMNCIKDGNRCLCCCGPYLPDANTRQCRNLKTEAADLLMKYGLIEEDDQPLPPPLFGPPPPSPFGRPFGFNFRNPQK